MSPESPVRVLPPWLEHPFRITSWYDMNKFSADEFVKIGAGLEWFGDLFEKGKWDNLAKDMGESMCNRLEGDLQAIGCGISAKAAHRLGFDCAIMKSFADLKSRFGELKDVISDEMGQQLFFWVPPERARYYEYPEDITKWNETEKAIDGPISTRFKKSAMEILAARKCYAVAQYTASVFHLMRASEVGLKALYKTLNIAAPKLADSWGNLLKPLDEQLKKSVADRHGGWATSPDFFDHATNDVRAMKRAWRDTTLHIESNYDEGGALKALNAVTSFFEHLSMKLDQDGNFFP